MFTVQGFRDGSVPYAVVIGGEGGEDAVGAITGGSGHIAAQLDVDHGQEFVSPPVGPVFVLDRDDPWCVLEWLYATTRVTDVEGEVPDAPDDDAVVPTGAVA